MSDVNAERCNRPCEPIQPIRTGGCGSELLFFFLILVLLFCFCGGSGFGKY